MTKRLVRALRKTFGYDVEDSADYLDLLRGIAAVDHMWQADPDFSQAGPFSLDLLRRVVAARPRPSPGWTRRPPAGCWRRQPKRGRRSAARPEPVRPCRCRARRPTG
ncbi:hypothetical protein NKH77_28890 [Streptomyces sp. M19]